ncbi:rRNA-processing protein CGR1 [Cryptococcus sp. DSM 104549]
MSSSTTPAPNPVVVSVALSNNGRTPGKAHKGGKTAVRRSYISPSIKTPFDKRMDKERAAQAAKQLEREMKEEKEEERVRKVTVIKERRARKEEKAREEEMRARMSAKKLQRMKKRLGRTKKING